MQKFLTMLVVVFTIFLFCLGCNAPAQEEVAVMPTEVCSESVEVERLYDSNVHYMALMVQLAADGDTDALDAAVSARNAKIEDMKLDYEPITTEEFLENYEYYSGFSLDKDYLAEMAVCCVNGDIESGLEAERIRNLMIDTLNLSDAKISFHDLFLLSKTITAEAGSCWLPMEWKMMVGEVLLNRVASVEFPNTIEGCVYQEGQYSTSHTQYFANLLPFEDCVEAAVRLLSGERLINDGSVVFQANFPQGSGTYLKLYHEKSGYTYLCYSSFPELYES